MYFVLTFSCQKRVDFSIVSRDFSLRSYEGVPYRFAAQFSLFALFFFFLFLSFFFFYFFSPGSLLFIRLFFRTFSFRLSEAPFPAFPPPRARQLFDLFFCTLNSPIPLVF